MNTYDKPNEITYESLPSGLALAFAQDVRALARFTSLSVAEQDEIIRRAKHVSSKDEMKKLVRSIEAGK